MPDTVELPAGAPELAEALSGIYGTRNPREGRKKFLDESTELHKRARAVHDQLVRGCTGVRAATLDLEDVGRGLTAVTRLEEAAEAWRRTFLRLQEAQGEEVPYEEMLGVLTGLETAREQEVYTPEFFLHEFQSLLTCGVFTEVKLVPEGSPEAGQPPEGTSDYFTAGARIEVVTIPFEVTNQGRDDYRVAFPPWKFVVPLQELREIPHGGYVFPKIGIAPGYNPNCSGTGRGMWHPHVERGGSICAGNGGPYIRQAFQSGLISEGFILLFKTLADTYYYEGFNDLHNWDDGITRCPVCRGEIEEGQGVECHKTRQLLHPGCATVVDGHPYLPSQTFRCASCATNRVFNDGDQLFDGHRVCPECPQMRRQYEQAELGVYVCPNCETEHADPENRLDIRNGWAGCTACVEDTGAVGPRGDRRYRIVRPGRLFAADMEIVGAFNPAFNNARYVPEVKPQRDCDCGAHGPADKVKTDMFGLGTVCPTCDPDELQLSQATLRDRVVMDGILQDFFSRRVDDFTLDFVETLSFVAAEVPLEQAARITQVIQKVSLGRLDVPAWMQVPLPVYVQAVNELTADVSIYPLLVSTANPEEEAFYAAEIQRRNPGGYQVTEGDGGEEYEEEYDEDDDYDPDF